MTVSPENTDNAALGMVWVPGGSFVMGSNAHYSEERPAHRRQVDGFWMDRLAVTNAEFARFVAATGHVTTAERPLDPADALTLAPGLRGAGSLVFRMTQGPVPLDDVAQWWDFVPGACWRHPEGPGSDISGRETLPVIHVSAEDAQAYARWAGKDLPDEAEWEYAARGGCPDDQTWPWGHHLTDDGRSMANTWQGEFPWQNLALDGFAGIAPAESFDANGYGLFNMIGNVWEWTASRFEPGHRAQKSCCAVGRGWRGRWTTGHQGRQPSVRAQLLPPLPPRRAHPARAARDHQPYRVSLHPASRRLSPVA